MTKIEKIKIKKESRMYSVIELTEISGYFLIGSFGVILNIDMILLLYSKLTNSVGSVFLINFAISNLVFALSTPTLLILAFNHQIWTMSSFVCKASSFLAEMSLNCSTFFLAIIIFDQYASVAHTWITLKVRTTSHANGVCLLIWIGSGVLSTT